MNNNYWGVKNATSLPELNAQSLVRNLKERYQRAYHQQEDEGGSGIYTWTGTVLLAVNPYQRLNVYGDMQIQHHFAKTITQADPHPFGIASHAYCTLNKTKSAQSIVVSGESGAGKTETAKFVMRFLSSIGRSTSFDDSISEFLESTNPILEAFGNAKTCRNENSSRFGKVMKLFYTQPNHQSSCNHKLVSAAVETYLLARSRVTHTPANERNYHVFYLLTNGQFDSKNHNQLPNNLKSVSRPASFFNYLSQSSNIQSGYLSDSDFLKEMLHAFDSLGVTKDDQSKLFELVFALLWMGNIQLESEDPKDSASRAKISNSSSEAVETVAKLLGLPSTSLTQLLTEQKLSIGTNNKSNSSLWTSTNVAKAKNVRDATVRRIYAKLFDYIVSLLNKKLARDIVGSGAKIDENRFISILDIFGFENLPTNGLEQLCINFANERLQNFFLRNVVISEAEEYSRECIPYPGVNPPDNGPVIRAIAGRNGIFDVLKKTTIDCMLRPLEGRDYDADFYASLGNTVLGGGGQGLTSSSSLGGLVKIQTVGGGLSNGVGQSKKTSSLNPISSTFIVCHYAEEVPYTIEGFVDCNKDSDSRVDFILSHFTNPLLVDVLAVPVPGDPTETFNTNSRNSDVGVSVTSSMMQQQRKCIATTFALQVDHLLTDHLEKTRLHCIRCIKPNDEKKPNCFNDDRVTNQLRVSGMFEVLTLMAHSFPIRIPYLDLFSRYKPLLNEKILTEMTRQTNVKTSSSSSSISGSIARLFVQETLSLLAGDDPGPLTNKLNSLLGGGNDSTLSLGSDFQFGTSKVFFKLGKVEPLEKLLAVCDGDKTVAKQIADLIGKRIMAKRKSRQLKFMRTSFKLLVIYRRRQNYWKWFYLYFVRMTFLVKSCTKYFIPKIKCRRILKKQAVRKIETAYFNYLENKRMEAAAKLYGLVLTFNFMKKLAGESKLKSEMVIASDMINGYFSTFISQAKLLRLRNVAEEQARAEELERLRLEAAQQAQALADLERVRIETEEARMRAEQDKENAAIVFLQTEEENKRVLEEANNRIADLQSNLESRIEEINCVKEEKRVEMEILAQQMIQAEELASMKMKQLEIMISDKTEEIKSGNQSHAAQLDALQASHDHDIAQFEQRLKEANDIIETKLVELETELVEKRKELEMVMREREQMIAQFGLEKKIMEENVLEKVREIERMKNEYEERIVLLERNHAEAILLLEQQVEKNRQQMETMTTTFDEEMSMLRKTHRDAVDMLESQIAQKCEEMEVLKQTTLEEQQEMEMKHVSELDNKREELKKLVANHELELESLKSQHLVLMETRSGEFTAIQAELESRKSEIENELSKVRESLNERISKLENELDLERNKLVAIEESHYAANDSIKAEHLQMMEQLRSEFTSRETGLKDEIEKLKSEIVEKSEMLNYTQNQREEMVESMRESHETEMKSLSNQANEMEQNLRQEIARLVVEIGNQTDNLSSMQSESVSALSALQAKYDSDIAAAQEELVATKYRLESEVDRLKTELEIAGKNFTEKCESYEEQIETIKTTSSDDLMFAKMRNQETENALNKRIQQLSETVDKNLQEMDDLKKDNLNEMESLKKENEVMVQRIREESEKVRVGLENQLATISAELNEKTSTLLTERNAHLIEVEGLVQTHTETLARRESELKTEHEETVRRMNETQNLISSEATRMLELKAGEIASMMAKNSGLETKLAEVVRMSTDEILGLQASLNETKSTLEIVVKEKSDIIATISARNEELSGIVETLRDQLANERVTFEQSLNVKTTEMNSLLNHEKAKFESALAETRAEISKITQQLEAVIKEKAQLAVVASQALAQADKTKREADEQHKRDKSEMERKIQTETSRIKRDMEIINKRALEVRLYEIEELKQETKRRLDEAEKMRLDAANILQKVNGKELAPSLAETQLVLSSDKEEVVQQAIRDYHSASDEYERSYVIERRKETTQRDREVESQQRSALEAKLHKTAVAVKVSEMANAPRKSLGNISNLSNGGAPPKTPGREQPDAVPDAKIPRLSMGPQSAQESIRPQSL